MRGAGIKVKSLTHVILWRMIGSTPPVHIAMAAIDCIGSDGLEPALYKERRNTLADKAIVVATDKHHLFREGIRADAEAHITSSSFYLEGMRTRLVNRNEIDFFVGLPWWGPGDTMTGTLIPGTTQMETLTSHNVNTIDSTQANQDDSKTAQYALGGHVDVSPNWRVSGEAALTNSTYDWRNPILDSITNVPNAYIKTNHDGTMHAETTSTFVCTTSSPGLPTVANRPAKMKNAIIRLTVGPPAITNQPQGQVT